MAFTLESLAAQYQEKTGCSDREAVKASLVMASLVAGLADDKAASDHFLKRANQMEAEDKLTA